MSVEQFTSRGTPSDLKEKLTAGEFNLWCAVNSKPYRLARHVWPDGAWEWDVEYMPGRPEGTVAYGTAQEDEHLAAMAAFAFVAGVEWQEALIRVREEKPEDWEEALSDSTAAQTLTAQAADAAWAVAHADEDGAEGLPLPADAGQEMDPGAEVPVFAAAGPDLSEPDFSEEDLSEAAVPPVAPFYQPPQAVAVADDALVSALFAGAEEAPAEEQTGAAPVLYDAVAGEDPGVVTASVPPVSPFDPEAIARFAGEEDFSGEPVEDLEFSVGFEAVFPAAETVTAEEFGDALGGDLGGSATPERDADAADPVEGADYSAADPFSAQDQDLIPEAAPLDEAVAEETAEEEEAYPAPPMTLLQQAPGREDDDADESGLAGQARMLETVLKNFKVRGEIMEVKAGPVVTLFEFEPVPGTKSSTVINLSDDIARSMSAVTARVAVVPGRSAIGVELPNATRETVYLREMLESPAYGEHGGRLPLVLGKDIGGDPVVVDLAKMPHLLIAGTTGSGKSVGINTMILSLLYRLSPQRCRLIMVDPKMLELSVYDGIPHLLTPVVTDPKKAVVALKWAVKEMETRYRNMAALGVRNIEGYNERAAELTARGEQVTRKVQTGFDRETGEPTFEDQIIDLTELPYIVVVVDEMADLMLVAGKEIEATIQRLAQMARAAGIHLIMATQRPSVDVITGTIKANFPTRISFQVTSKIDSRTILGEQGAEQLLGQGDMLYMASGGRVTRVHGPFVSDTEVERVVRHLKDFCGEPDYLHTITEEEDDSDGDDDAGGAVFDASAMGEGGYDDPYDQAVALVLREQKVSVSFIQRHLQIGYNRAARIVEKMEAEGIISAANHVGKRDILVAASRYLADRGGNAE
ncbi:DNA translocase FtsK [Novispirillum itersonii]|uniref:S-DNA-T family DNA segregation ATPase FtsK/SpoIIIE n=1 Tax=Novispirillum itersonii TaxID=189 RepID=A0A7X0DLV5_NOVIT|nr:DNA translocase FtsK [Novispirillum itersonii]MBB6210393.1 S-DNA-T family DNA segregation ATPase FtsK/SpoIIIE [Novispirillum itersonii]